MVAKESRMYVFSKRSYDEWKHILLGEKNNFVPERLVSEWKNKGQTNMDIVSLEGKEL